VSHKVAPHYDCLAFIRACAIRGAVRITKNARQDAKNHFNLDTESRALEFIANDGLQDLQFDNTNSLDKGPGQDIGKPVDGYTFRAGAKYGYLAFYLNFKGGWIIKSFHPPRVGERTGTLTHNPFLEKIKELK
jgi:hypothetical protein